MKNKRGADVIHVYTPRSEAIAGETVLAIVFLLIQAAFIFRLPAPKLSELSTQENLVIIICFLLLDSILVWHSYIFSAQTRLIVYEDGIDIERGRSHRFVAWEKMSHFERRGFGRSSRYGIRLSEKIKPEPEGIVERLMNIIGGWPNDFLELEPSFFYFAKRWRGLGQTIDIDKLYDSTFGQELYHFAPHLFEYEKEKVKNG